MSLGVINHIAPEQKIAGLVSLYWNSAMYVSTFRSLGCPGDMGLSDRAVSHMGFRPPVFPLREGRRHRQCTLEVTMQWELKPRSSNLGPELLSPSSSPLGSSFMQTKADTKATLSKGGQEVTDEEEQVNVSQS